MAAAGLGLWLLAGVWGAVAGGQTAPLPAGTSDTDTAPAATKVDRSTAAALAEAEAKLDSRDYAGAAALLDVYLTGRPEDARAMFDRGYVEDAQGRSAAAEPYYRRAIAADPKQFEARLALGLMLAGRGSNEAQTQLAAAVQLEPKPPNPAAQAQAGRALAQLVLTSDPEAARQALLGALKLSPETPADTLLTGEIADAAGDPETAEQAYRRVLAGTSKGSADGSQATSGLVHLLIAQKKYADAEQLLRKALENNGTDAVLNSQLANVLMAEGKPDEAAATLETVHAARPADRNVTRLLAELYTQAGQAAKADPLYVQLMAYPGAPAPDAALLAARGDNLIRQKRFADAAPVLKQATALDPQNGDAWSSLAFAASESHQAQLTLDALAMRSKVMSETPATYFLAATAWDTLHQTKRAVEMYKQFLTVAGGKFPDEEWQAQHRLIALARAR